jgi:hypothetical protein
LILIFTFNNIHKEIKELPTNRLNELYEFVHSLNPKVKKSDTMRKKILAFAGIFSDMSDKDYADFSREIKRTRSNLFDQKFE